ncbi:hypothetical protein B0T25DRAFT_364178 [Lasiosphaeria hispida]|uniref:Uncharacterized protein n=1 Tax=Lasiosphaeria hispida TaxID=260671 RepID=A0AAJ0H5W0_9PEZI|nr:hypothetical protein B0T25DRAFT_364178 [Lasiosphaeria hispida]
MEDITVLSSYAETTYQGTVVDPADMAAIAESLPRLSGDSAVPPNPRAPSPRLSQQPAAARSRGTDSTGPSTQPIARSTLDEISSPSTGSINTPSDYHSIHTDSLDPNHLTSALTGILEHVDGIGNRLSNRLILTGWKQREKIGPHPGFSPLFRTVLEHLQYTEAGPFNKYERLPPKLHHRCEVALFKSCPKPRLTVGYTGSEKPQLFLTATFLANVSGAPPIPDGFLFSIPENRPIGCRLESGVDSKQQLMLPPDQDPEEVILTFSDQESLQEFHGHLVGTHARANETKHEFPLAGYAIKARPDRLDMFPVLSLPFNELAITEQAWSKVSIFLHVARFRCLHRLVVESQDGLTLIDDQIGTIDQNLIRLGSTVGDKYLLVWNRNPRNFSTTPNNNLLLFTDTAVSTESASINKELRHIQARQTHCEYRFQDLGSLHRFQEALIGHTVLFDGWPYIVFFQLSGILQRFKTPKNLATGKDAEGIRVQVLRGHSSGNLWLAIFWQYSVSRFPHYTLSFQFSSRGYYVKPSRDLDPAGYGVTIEDDSCRLPNLVRPDEGWPSNDSEFLDLRIGHKVLKGKSNKISFYFKETAE